MVGNFYPYNQIVKFLPFVLMVGKLANRALTSKGTLVYIIQFNSFRPQALALTNK